MDLKEIGFNTKNWVDSAQDRDYWRPLVNAVLNLRLSYAMELSTYFFAETLCYVIQTTNVPTLNQGIRRVMLFN